MMKNLVAVMFTLITFGGFAVLGNSLGFLGILLESMQNIPFIGVSPSPLETEAEKFRLINKAEPASLERSAIPDHVLYESVFRKVMIFNGRAKSQEARGEIVTEFRNYFRNEAKLTFQEDDLLTQTANDYGQETEVIDAQAEIIVEQIRQQYQAGSLPADQLIQPTPELLQLQQQRNELASRYKEQLRELLGKDKFIEFDNFVHGRYASGFRSMPISSVQDLKDNGGVK